MGEGGARRYETGDATLCKLLNEVRDNKHMLKQ